MKKINPVLAKLIILVLLFAVALTMASGIADAEPTATRTLPKEPVFAGTAFTIEIEASGYGFGGKVVETLPEGFSYTTSTLPPKQAIVTGENTVEFILFGGTSFTYTVTAPDTEGTYTFSGKLIDADKEEHEIKGDTEIEVEESEEDAEPIATRTIPEEPISAGENFTVTIEALYYGTFGNIIETLPEGFVYENSTLSPERIEVEDDTVRFELWGEPSFTYTVIAPDTEGTYTFDGILIDDKENEHDIDGDTKIEVGEKSSEVTLPANITAWNPIEAIVNNAKGESRTFNISVNQPADISWQINGTEVQTNESATEAVYTNTSAVVGIWNVSAIATNTTTAMHSWTWRVTSVSAVNITLTPTPAPTPAATPTHSFVVTPTPSPNPSATPVPTPSPPGFEAGFAFTAIFAVALSHILLQRKRGDS